MLRLLFTALCLTILVPMSPGLSLDEVPGLVKRQNRDVLASAKGAEAAEQEKGVALARYFPTLDLKGTYTRLNDDLQIHITPKTFSTSLGGVTFGIEVAPPPIFVRDKNVFNSHLLLTQPLYAGGRITAGSRAAEAKSDEARLNRSRTESEKIAEALERYNKVRLALAVKTELDKIRANVGRLEQIADVLVKQGMAPKFSTYQVKVAKADVDAKLHEAEAKRRLAEMAFRSTVSEAGGNTFSFDSPLRMPAKPATLEPFVADALSKREEFGILEAKHRQVEALKTAETGKMLPTLYAFGKYELIPSQLTQLQPKWAVGVGIDIPLTAGLSAFPERKKAELLEASVELMRDKAKTDIPLQVQSYYTEVESRAAELEAVAEGRSMATEAERLAEIRFKSGDGSALEVLQANTELEKMEIRRWQTLEAYNAGLIRLYQAAGNVEGYLSAYATAAKETPK